MNTLTRRTLLFSAVALFGFSATVVAACRDRWCTTNYYACLIANGCQPP